jgi:hypothetical protein
MNNTLVLRYRIHGTLPPNSYMPSQYGALIQEVLTLPLQRMNSITSEAVTHMLVTSDNTAVFESFCHEVS